ncbi:MAG: cobalt ECF transporter T component CbiQ [Firmicutes bacterium]|nr:cobalt ECF transporter T component CbiQ [Bacillota bacterium]
MEMQLDRYAYLDKPLHRWEPRCKLAGIMVLIFAFSYVRDLRLLPVILALSGGMYLYSGLPGSFLLSRLRLPALFLVAVALILPFVSGPTVLMHLGPLTLKEEGCLELLRITVKFLAILTMAIMLFGSMPFLTAVKAMRGLGLPVILADMTMFAYRYLFEIGDDLKTMQTAMGLRGFRNNKLGGAGSLAALAGTILVRSFEQSDRVYKAMILRGYGQPASYQEDFHARPVDVAGMLLLILAAAAIVAAELLWR